MRYGKRVLRITFAIAIAIVVVVVIAVAKPGT